MSARVAPGPCFHIRRIMAAGSVPAAKDQTGYIRVVTGAVQQSVRIIRLRNLIIAEIRLPFCRPGRSDPVLFIKPGKLPVDQKILFFQSLFRTDTGKAVPVRSSIEGPVGRRSQQIDLQVGQRQCIFLIFQKHDALFRRPFRQISGFFRQISGKGSRSGLEQGVPFTVIICSGRSGDDTEDQEGCQQDHGRPLLPVPVS